MNKNEKRKKMKIQREKLINSLEKVYQHAFDELSNMDIEEASIAKLCQAFLLSRDAAIDHLKQEIEKPIITHAPNQK